MLKGKPVDTQQQMTEFGRTLVSFMLTRGIEYRQELARLLNEGGYSISQARLSYYLNGERNVDALFVACVSELLRLNKEERRKLAWVYAYGQLRPDDEGMATVEKFRAVL